MRGMIPEVAADPDLDAWLPEPAIRVAHRRESSAPAQRLWRAACELRLSDTYLLGRLIRWRIPGTAAHITFEQLFRNPPFTVLEEAEGVLIAGLAGRIWTLRRDYPHLADPAAFRTWAERGTARALFANWVAEDRSGRAWLRSETRVEAFGAQGGRGLAAVRPLVAAFHHLVATDALAAAARLAERG
jgi:hypothetical protein